MDFYAVENEIDIKIIYNLYMQSIRLGECLFESMDISEFQDKLFIKRENMDSIHIMEKDGKAFASGCIDYKTGKAFITLIVVEQKHRRKGIGKSILKLMEEKLISVGGFQSIELSFFNPIMFSWRIPGENANHPNIPGVDMESGAYLFFKSCGYEDFAIQNCYYLSLSDYEHRIIVEEKKENLRKNGISFEIYDRKIHSNMKELIEGFKNPMWLKDILLEKSVDEGGRPILVPVYMGAVCGFTGPLDVESNGRGYFAGIGIDAAYRGKGIATVLFCTLCKELKEMGASYMTLFTGENNPARNIYESAGFVVVRTFADMRKKL